jgi:hypothetical protein
LHAANKHEVKQEIKEKKQGMLKHETILMRRKLNLDTTTPTDRPIKDSPDSERPPSAQASSAYGFLPDTNSEGRSHLGASNSSKIKRQTTLSDYNIKSISKETKAISDRQICEFVFLCGLPFSVVDSIPFLCIWEAHYGGSGYNPPKRKYVASTGLDLVYSDVRGKVTSLIKQCNIATARCTTTA